MPCAAATVSRKTARHGLAAAAVSSGLVIGHTGARTFAGNAASSTAQQRDRSPALRRGGAASVEITPALGSPLAEEPAAAYSQWAPGVAGVSALAVGMAAAHSRRHRRSSRRVATMLRSVATEEQVDVTTEQQDTLVKKNSVLVLGGTGTLGRQVVRQFLNAGYSVRCLIRDKVDRPFSFLVDWGATVTSGSLTRPETLASSLIGVHTVIDCSTARPEESIYDIDWEGKKKFIGICEKMQVQRYIFTSIKDCDAYQNVPLMEIKHKTELLLAQSSLRYTIVRLSGFMQPLITQFAVNILDEQQVWGDDGTSPGIAYVDSQDCARMVAAATLKERTIGKTLTVTGPKVWSTGEIIKMCEQLSGREAKVNEVQSLVLQLTQVAAGCFEWSIDIAERLRFVEVNSMARPGEATIMTAEAYELLGLDPANTRKLETYIGEYYRRILKFISMGEYKPEEGEVEREQEEEDAKLKKAFAAAEADYLPDGFTKETEVSVLEQREMSQKITDMYDDMRRVKLEGDDAQWFGLTPIAEIANGRSAMMGFSLGLFTEWATEVSIPKQIDQLIGIFSAPS